MQYTSTVIPASHVADVYESAAHSSRAPGWHVSTLVRRGWALLGGKKPYPYDDADTLGLAAAGRAWEGVLREYVRRLPGYDYIPDVELKVDGITGNADGLLHRHGDNALIVEEVKFKFSQIKQLEDYPLELYQVMAYCHMAGTRLAVMFYGSITSKPPQFSVVQHDIEFTEKDIADAWKFIVASRNYLESKGIKPEGV